MIKIIHQNHTSQEFKVKIQTHCKDLGALFAESNLLDTEINEKLDTLNYERG